MSNLLQDLRYALRTLLKRPGFTVTAVVTLALGIAATTTVFSAMDSLLLRPLPFAEPERLALVWGTNLKDGQGRDVIAGPNFIDLHRQNKTLEGLAAFHLDDMTARMGDGVGVIGEMRVTPEFFSVLGVRPVLGRAFEAADGLPGRSHVALLGHGFWQQRFGGDPAVIGKTLEPLGQPHTIIGVLPPGFLFFSTPDVVTPLEPSALEKMPRTNYHYWAVARLKPGVNRSQAEADLDGIMKRLGAEYPVLKNWEVTLDPVQGTLSEPVRPALVTLLAAAAMLLLIGCANVANLLLARGAERRWELALRSALGASRARLMSQLLMESFVIALLGGIFGAFGADGLVSLLGRILPQAVAIPGSAAMVALPSIAMNAKVLCFAALLSGATVLLCGWIPATRYALAPPGDALQSAASRVTVDRRTRGSQRALVLAETALATVLLIAAGLMVRTVRELLRTDPGFRAQNVVAMYVGGVDELADAQRARYYADVLECVRAVPGVAAAGLNDYVLLQNEDDYEGFVRDGLPLTREYVKREEWRRVSPGYFAAMGIARQRGRNFTKADNADAPSVVILNEAMARKHWPGEDAVGKRMWITNAKHRMTEIVGVVADERTVGIDVPAKPMFYVPFHRAPRPVMGLFVRTEGQPAERLGAIQQAVWSVDRTRPIYGTVQVETLVSDSIAVRQLTLTVALAVAAGALALTGVGIFAVVSYTTAQRTREFGIRAALGAQPGDLRTLVLREELSVAFAGIAAGAALAAALAQAISSLLYGVTPFDGITYLSVCVLLTFVAGLACWIPARRATRVDPMIALRYE